MTVKVFARIFLTKNISSVKRFSSAYAKIPGPLEWPLVGHGPHFMPFVGKYSLDRFVDAHEDLHKRYGRMVKLTLGEPLILLFHPEDVQKMLMNEGVNPARPLFHALRYYRRQRPHCHMGLVTENGEDWREMRRHVTFLMKPDVVAKYLDAHVKVVEDFIRYLDRQRDADGNVDDLMSHLYNFAQEAIGVVCFGIRLGCLNDPPSVDTRQFVRAVEETLEAMGRTLLAPPIWKLVKTKDYKKLEETQDFLWKCTSFHLEEAMRHKEDFIGSSNNNPFLNKILGDPTIHPLDRTLLTTEIFQGGIDATATTIAMLLYNLALNPDCQSKLRQEVITEFDQTIKNIDKCEYLNMSIKETLRLNPTAVGNARIIPTPLTLGGITCPAGSTFVGCHPVMGHSQEFIKDDPNAFKPERWSRINGRLQHHQFISKPFGFGVRMCPGARLAEQEIKLAIIKILQRYEVKIRNAKPVSMVMRLNLTPDQKMDFQFIKIN